MVSFSISPTTHRGIGTHARDSVDELRVNACNDISGEIVGICTVVLTLMN